MDDRLSAVRAAVAARLRAPVDEREAASAARFLAELDRLPRPFDEAGAVHVTASAVVVGARGVVLHRHRRLGLWLQPGGHVEPGETPEDAACREVAEETGIAASHPPGGPAVVHVDVHPGARGHTHLDLRYLLHVADDQEPAPPAGESQDVRWFAWDEALACADPGLVGALRALAPPGSGCPPPGRAARMSEPFKPNPEDKEPAEGSPETVDRALGDSGGEPAGAAPGGEGDAGEQGA